MRRSVGVELWPGLAWLCGSALCSGVPRRFSSNNASGMCVQTHPHIDVIGGNIVTQQQVAIHSRASRPHQTMYTHTRTRLGALSPSSA